MGMGVAAEAATRFPGLRQTLGRAVRASGNVPVVCPSSRIISFPTKHHWRNTSDLTLIRASANQLMLCWPIVVEFTTMAGMSPLPICLPKVGCGYGGLDWDTQVYPVLRDTLDENYIVVL